MSKGLSKLLIPFGGGAAAGGIAGFSLKSKFDKKTIEEAKKLSYLADKLREQSESKNRRLENENYYLRKALNEMAERKLNQGS